MAINPRKPTIRTPDMIQNNSAFEKNFKSTTVGKTDKIAPIIVIIGGRYKKNGLLCAFTSGKVNIEATTTNKIPSKRKTEIALNSRGDHRANKNKIAVPVIAPMIKKKLL